MLGQAALYAPAGTPSAAGCEPGPRLSGPGARRSYARAPVWAIVVRAVWVGAMWCAKAQPVAEAGLTAHLADSFPLPLPLRSFFPLPSHCRFLPYPLPPCALRFGTPSHSRENFAAFHIFQPLPLAQAHLLALVRVPPIIELLQADALGVVHAYLAEHVPRLIRVETCGSSNEETYDGEGNLKRQRPPRAVRSVCFCSFLKLCTSRLQFALERETSISNTPHRAAPHLCV